MKALVVYDSVHGNTEQIAKAIGDAMPDEVQVVRAGEADAARLRSFDLIIVGAPTYGGRPTQPVQNFLKQVSRHALEGINVAAFDTRIPAKWVRIFSFAAPRIAESLTKKGGTLIGSPEGFFVDTPTGPLTDGELERAAGWAEEIAKGVG